MLLTEYITNGIQKPVYFKDPCIWIASQKSGWGSEAISDVLASGIHRLTALDHNAGATAFLDP